MYNKPAAILYNKMDIIDDLPVFANITESDIKVLTMQLLSHVYIQNNSL